MDATEWVMGRITECVVLRRRATASSVLMRADLVIIFDACEVILNTSDSKMDEVSKIDRLFTGVADMNQSRDMLKKSSLFQSLAEPLAKS